MKSVLRMITVALLVLALAGTAFAQTANQRMEGKKGIGYFSSDAPVGVRYWMNDGMAVDFGVGISLDTKNTNPGDNSDETLLDVAFDVGLPIVMHGEENMIVYFRPGVMFKREFSGFATPPAEGAADTNYDIFVDVGLALGGEFFLSQLGWPNLSFSGQVGLNLEIISPGAEGAETDVNFMTSRDDVSIVNTGSVGFHIYF